MKKMFLLTIIAALVMGALAVCGAEAMLPDVNVQFGADSAVYVMHPYDSDTMVELYRNITDQGRQLPIYDFDNYDGWESFQYYDIPSYYSIPEGDQQLVSEEKAGEVYYSAPNRVIVFYRDAQIPMNMMKVGYFDATEQFTDDVANNKPLDYWGNLLVWVRYAD